MENTIIYREIKRSDYRALEKIIRDTWNYEQFCTQKTAKKMSRLYLASCLANQNFTCVAIRDDIPVGVIMGKDERYYRPKIRYFFRLLIIGFTLFINKESRNVAKMFKNFEILDNELLKECGKTFDGELAFFAISSNQRGMGIGKELFNRALNFMKSQHIKSFYLYTDITCNYGFYEHQGMVRLKERNYNLRPYVEDEILFFLYEYSFENIP